MAAVYLARDLALNRNVAIKVMAPGLLMGPGMVDRFRQEAVTVANLHHPNIVTIHTVRQAGSLHFFVMQVVDGAPLEEILERPEPIPVYLVQAILYQLGVGLAYAHRRGVIHRDIKPANVLMDQEGNAILTDFGIAKVTTASNLTQTGSTIGTPAYMSPEQCMARELSGASDQYSLGIVAYEMLTGHPPYSGSPFEIMQAHTSGTLPPIRDSRPDCPPELEAAVFRMLAKNPEDRFPDVAEAIEALGGYLPGPQDPIRADLARLVRKDGGGPLPEREPLRPTPGRAATPVPSSRVEKKVPRGRGRLPLWITGAVALGTVVAVLAVSLRPSPEVDPVPAPAETPSVSSIQFANPQEEILVGATIQVRAELQDASGGLVTGQEVDWTSTDPEVASVQGTGEDVQVTGVSPGTAAVVARAGDSEARFSVSVVAPAAGELSVSAPGREVVVGSSVALSAILTDETGARISDPQVTWQSSNPRVLQVNPETGVATGRSLGRADVTASSGDQTGSVRLNVVGRVEGISVIPPTAPLQAGATAVLRSRVTAQPGDYRGTSGLRWTSSNSGVASVARAEGDSVVLTLLRAGETVVTAQAEGVQGSVNLQVNAAAPSVTLDLSPGSVSLEAVSGAGSPASGTVEVAVTGNAAPSLGSVEYGGGGDGWLTPSLGSVQNGRASLTLRADTRSLGAGSYTARLPVAAGDVARTLEIRLTVAVPPEDQPVEANDATAQQLTALLADYSNAINQKNVNRARELFPSLPQDAVDDLLRIPESDTYYLQLAPGSLRLGQREGTLEGDVMSGVLGRDNRGELIRMIYTFARGQRGWYIVSLRAGG